jgi:hypothetical protein
VTKLSDTQLVVLSAACQRPDRSIYPLTTKLPGGAAAKVLGSLLNKSLIKEVQAKREDIVWREDKKRCLTLRATSAAFKALGIHEDPTDPEAVSPAEGKRVSGGSRKASMPKPEARGTRADSKQAKLVEMLMRPEGASIEEIVVAFGWQAHTVRGAIAGALKKKLGFNVVSEKIEGRGRIYRIA